MKTEPLEKLPVEYYAGLQEPKDPMTAHQAAIADCIRMARYIKCSGVGAITPHFRMGQKAWVPRYRNGQPDEPMEATVGEIKIEISKEGVTEAYMCEETGIGTGTLYTLGESIFDTEEECRAACIADFIPANSTQ